MSQVISLERLRGLVDGWLHAGKRVFAPVRVKPDLVLYESLENAAQLLLDGFVRPANSIKEFVFPRHEVLYGYQFKGKQIELVPKELPTRWIFCGLPGRALRSARTVAAAPVRPMIPARSFMV